MGDDTGSPRRNFAVFYVSLMAICAELCLSLMLSLKAYSHMVYVVISFALLGYGIGSTLFLLLKKSYPYAAMKPLTFVWPILLITALVATATVLRLRPRGQVRPQHAHRVGAVTREGVDLHRVPEIVMPDLVRAAHFVERGEFPGRQQEVDRGRRAARAAR